MHFHVTDSDTAFWGVCLDAYSLCAYAIKLDCGRRTWRPIFPIAHSYPISLGRLHFDPELLLDTQVSGCQIGTSGEDCIQNVQLFERNCDSPSGRVVG